MLRTMELNLRHLLFDFPSKQTWDRETYNHFQIIDGFYIQREIPKDACDVE